jgi:hypothetical protein
MRSHLEEVTIHEGERDRCTSQRRKNTMLRFGDDGMSGEAHSTNLKVHR